MSSLAERPADHRLNAILVLLQPVRAIGQTMLALLEHKRDKQHGELTIGQASPRATGLPGLA